MTEPSEGVVLAFFERYSAELLKDPEWRRRFAETARRVSGMSFVSSDLLPHLLGYAWRHARRISLVCRKWAQIVRETQFWEYAIRSTIRAMITKEIDPNFASYMLKYWTPFNIPSLDTRYAQLLWLFEPFRLRLKKDGCFLRGTHLWYASGSAVIHLHNRVYTVVHGTSSEYRGLLSSVARSYIDDPRVDTLTWVDNRLGLRWQGTGLEVKKDKPVPHGKGTWTFADGSTLSGDNVAFDGHVHDGQEWFAGKRRKIDENE